jgi:mevalonate kinase
MLTGNFYRDIQAIRNTKDTMLLAQWAKELEDEKQVVEQIKNKQEREESIREVFELIREVSRALSRARK